jgi:Putative zinc-finger
MKCEECLPRIEEYVDGELDGRMAERISAHLTTCAECASEFAELQREQQIYAQYQRPVEVTPAQWNIVRARIEQEKDAPAQKPRTRLREWFSPRKNFRPVYVAALVLVMVGLAAGLIYLGSLNRQRPLASQPEQRHETLPHAGTTQTLPPGNSNENRVAVADDGKQENSNSKHQTPSVANNAATTTRQKKTTAAVARVPRAEKRRGTVQMPDNGAQLVEAAADRNYMITGVRRSAPEGAGDFDFEIARHAERAELLLRSFRNVRLSASNRALDVSYEKAQSRKLLYQNIALRRDAAARRDQAAAEVLNTLEPILLDIANLPNRAKARDVRSIEQRMEKKEIVATLQVRTLVASN